MTTSLAAILLAIIKAIKPARDLFFEIQDQYQRAIISKLDNEEIKARDERKALMVLISKAETNEDRKILSRALHRLNLGELSKRDR